VHTAQYCYRYRPQYCAVCSITLIYGQFAEIVASEKSGVEEHNGDVKFKSGFGNMVVSCMRSASGHNCRAISVIVDLAVGQIPRSTERITSYEMRL